LSKIMDGLVKISIGTHSRDCHDVGFEFNDQMQNFDHSGYAPDICGVSEYGDDMIFLVDVETGKILNWDTKKIKESLQNWYEDNIDGDYEDE